MDEFSLGVLSGVTAAAVIALITLLVKKVVIPSAQQIFGSEPSLDGKWKIFHCRAAEIDQVDDAGEVNIKQVLHRIKADATSTRHRGGEKRSRNRSLKWEGEIASRILTYRFEDQSDSGFFGVGVLRLMKDKRTLEGKVAYCDIETNEPKCYDYSLRKIL